MFNYSIKLNDINNNKIGFISFIYNEKTKYIYISFLNVYNAYKSKGYGTLLILFSIKYIIDNIHNSYFIKNIKLDDCSDYSGNSNSIYYKLGFRNYNSNYKEELFVKFFNKKKNDINLKTIYDLYDYIYKNNLDKLNNIDYKLLLFKINIYNSYNIEFNKIKKIKFNLHEKIKKNFRITRNSKL